MVVNIETSVKFSRVDGARQEVKVFRSFRGVFRSRNVGKLSNFDAPVCPKKKSLNSVAVKASKLIETCVLVNVIRVGLVQ